MWKRFFKMWRRGLVGGNQLKVKSLFICDFSCFYNLETVRFIGALFFLDHNPEL